MHWGSEPRQEADVSARMSALMARLNGSSAAPAPDTPSEPPTPAPPVVATRPVTTPVTTETAANDASQRLVLWLHPCGSCTLRRTPGAAWPGYCVGREDLPLAYGLLHELPADLGEQCHRYSPRG